MDLLLLSLTIRKKSTNELSHFPFIPTQSFTFTLFYCRMLNLQLNGTFCNKFRNVSNLRSLFPIFPIDLAFWFHNLMFDLCFVMLIQDQEVTYSRPFWNRYFFFLHHFPVKIERFVFFPNNCGILIWFKKIIFFLHKCIVKLRRKVSLLFLYFDSFFGGSLY